MSFKFNSIAGRLINASQMKSYLPQGLSVTGETVKKNLEQKPVVGWEDPHQKVTKVMPYYTESDKVYNEASEGPVPGLPNLPLLKELQRCTVGPIGTYPDTETYKKWVLRPQLRVQLDEEVMNRPTHLMNGTKDKIGLYFALILTAYTTYLAYYIMWGLACPEKRLKFKEKYHWLIAP